MTKNPLTDLIVVDYFHDEDHMLGAFRVKSEKTGEVFILEPNDKRFVLYFDPELFGWMIDEAPLLRYHNDLKVWGV